MTVRGPSLPAATSKEGLRHALIIIPKDIDPNLYRSIYPSA
jgi:hypothetical protein